MLFAMCWLVEIVLSHVHLSSHHPQAECCDSTKQT